MLNVTDPCTQTKAPIRQALEDATVTALTAFVGGLIAVGGEPTLGIIWGTALPALLIGLYSYGSARKIQNVRS